MHVVTSGVNKPYLPRLLVLWQSLQETGSQVHLHVLCFDTAAADWLAKAGLPNVTFETLDWLEQTKPELLPARASRPLIEYFFMLKPYMVESAFERYPNAELIAYSDSDIMFFESFEHVIEAIGDENIGICPHRFALADMHQMQFGTYNAGFYVLRNNDAGHHINDIHKKMCLASTRDSPADDGIYCDQKYLNVWPRFGRGVKSLDHAGMNLAPWNIRNHLIHERKGKITADGMPLVFYHYHGLKEPSPGSIIPGYYGVEDPALASILDDFIYRPHLEKIAQMKAWVFPEDKSGFILNKSIRQNA